MPKDNKPFERDSVMPFGKYKGKTVQAIMDENIGYIRWASQNLDRVKFSQDILNELEATKDEAPF